MNAATLELFPSAWEAEITAPHGTTPTPSHAQGTAGWLAERCGQVTASKVGDLIARTKTGWSASRGAYMGQLMAERLTGEPASSPTTAPMRWGLEQEGLARNAYSFRTDLEVVQVGLVPHPRIAGSAASPDGLVGHDGLVEIKCPTTITHLETLASGELPAKHKPQIQWQLACTGRAWCDFVSFDPRLPEALKLFIVRVEREQAHITELEVEVIAFLVELDARLDALTASTRHRAAA